MASFFLSFGINMGYFFGRICNPVFDFFFAVKTIYSSDNHYYLQTAEKEIVRGAHPSLFMGHISVKFKFFHRRSSGSQK